jgi:hypothetical protein
MRAVGIYDQIKLAFQDIVAPELHALRGELRVLDQKIDGTTGSLEQMIAGLDQKIAGLDQKVEQKIDGVDARLTIKIDALRTETVSMKGELLAEIRRLDTRMDGMDRELRTAIDVRERLAALEARRS